MLKYMVLFVATSLRNVQFAFLSQGVLSLRNQFSVVFNRKVSDGWLYFRNSYEKGLSLSLDRAVDEQWFQHNGGQSSCPGDQDGSDLTGISENWAVAFYKPVCGEKEKPLFRVWDSAHSLMIIILQLLLRTSPCSGPSSPPLSLQTLAQSRSAPHPGHQQTECSPLWGGYSSLWVCSDAVNKFSLPNKPPHLNPYFQLLGTFFHCNMEISMQSSLVLKLEVPAIKTAAAILADTDLFSPTEIRISFETYLLLRSIFIPLFDCLHLREVFSHHFLVFHLRNRHHIASPQKAGNR